MDAIPSVCLLNPAAQTTDTLYGTLPVDTDTQFQAVAYTFPIKSSLMEIIHPPRTPLSSPTVLSFLHFSCADIPYTDALSLHQDTPDSQ